MVAHRIATSKSTDISDEMITVRIEKFKIDKRTFDSHYSYHHTVYRMANYSNTSFKQYDLVNSFSR